MSDYEQKQAAKRDRLTAASAKAATRADAAHTRARAIGAAIPFGQPILVGHHSEGRARRDASRIHSLTGKAIAEGKRAGDLARRAAAVGTAGVSADDPDAIAKLEAELVALERQHARSAAIVAAIRKGAKSGPPAQLAALAALGVEDGLARRLIAGTIPAWSAANRSANIRRIKARIAELQARAAAPERAPIEGDGYTIYEDRAANRVRITFAHPRRPAVVAALRSCGFRWAPSFEAWQRQASNAAWAAAQRAVAAIGGAGPT